VLTNSHIFVNQTHDNAYPWCRFSSSAATFKTEKSRLRQQYNCNKEGVVHCKLELFIDKIVFVLFVMNIRTSGKNNCINK